MHFCCFHIGILWLLLMHSQLCIDNELIIIHLPVLFVCAVHVCNNLRHDNDTRYHQVYVER